MIHVKGSKGFNKGKYDPEMMGEYIIENLLGLVKAGKLSEKERQDYKKEKYPIVMSFFRTFDLQPTLHNLRTNKQAIIEFGTPSAPVENNFIGEEKEKFNFRSLIIPLGHVLIVCIIIKSF